MMIVKPYTYFEGSVLSEVPTSLLYSEQTVVVSLLQQKAIQGTYLPKMDHSTKYEPFATALF